MKYEPSVFKVTAMCPYGRLRQNEGVWVDGLLERESFTLQFSMTIQHTHSPSPFLHQQYKCQAVCITASFLLWILLLAASLFDFSRKLTRVKAGGFL